MNLTTSKEANINYLAKIIRLEDSNFSPHPNADKLKLVHLYGNTISTSIDTQPGIYVYFPVECVVAPEFLKFHNLYRDVTLNNDPIAERGFFEESGRVKCIKLRGIASEGFIMPYSALYAFIVNPKDVPKDMVKFYEEACNLVDTTFDTIEDTKLVWKYVIKTKTSGVNLNGKSKKATMSDKIIDQQFRFHIDTPKLQDNIYKLNPQDLIQISIKQHGTSAIFCNLLTKRKLNWREKIARKLGISVVDQEYTVFCSSRKVIKDPLLNPGLTQGYYDCDIWNLGLEVIKNYLVKGMTIYAEIVGYMPTGSAIQAKWDYKCIYDPKVYNYKEMSATQMYQAKLFDIIIYRITMTNADGKVHEYSARQVLHWCLDNGLHPVNELYYGKAGDLYDIDTQNHWNENFIDKLREEFLEKDSILCNNKVPEEGIVLRREVNNIDVYKLKANRFLQKETQELDKGIIDIESIQE